MSREVVLDANVIVAWLDVAEQERLLPDILATVASTGGRLNFNDALLVVLQREGSIGEVASFDAGFDAVPTFARLT